MKLFGFILVLLGTALPLQAQQPTASAPELYQIIPGDRLFVTVLEDANLNSQVLVRPDGRITLPIAGSILVLGRSPEQVQAIIRSRLAGSFNVTPTVTVSVNELAEPELQRTSYYVLGEVRDPGLIEVLPPRTLNVLQALAQAGGLGRFARSDSIQIRRFDPMTGAETIFPFNFEALEDGVGLETNIELQDGDVIFVPERGLFN